MRHGEAESNAENCVLKIDKNSAYGLTQNGRTKAEEVGKNLPPRVSTSSSRRLCAHKTTAGITGPSVLHEK